MFVFKRNDIYYVEFFDEAQQKKRRLSTGKKTKDAALRYIEHLTADAKEAVASNHITLNVFAEEYKSFSNSAFSPNYRRSIEISLKMLLEFIGDVDIECITNRDVERFLGFTYKRAKYVAHLYYRTLKAAFNKAIQWSYISNNPFKGAKPPKLQKKLPDFITEAELLKIMQGVESESLKCLYYTGFHTGMRLSELISLQWKSVDLPRRIITVGNTDAFITKSKCARIIPINSSLHLRLTERFKNSKSWFVFPKENDMMYNLYYVSHRFKKAVVAAGIARDIHFHSLRHSFASNLVQNGVSLYIVKELLGHADISTTQIYAHLNKEALSNAVEVLSQTKTVNY